MTFQEFLDFELINYSKFHLRVSGVVGVIVIYLLTRLILAMIKKALLAVSKSKRFDQGRVLSVFQVVRYFVWFFVFIIILTLLGLDLTWIMAGSAALMVGVGLGIQYVFMDFISGVIILFDGSVVKGDIIQSEKTVGIVTKVSLRCIELHTRDNVVILIPNHKLTSENVVNLTHMKSNPRFCVEVSVAYGSDTKLVRELLLATCNDFLKIDKTPKPFVRFGNFGESSLDFQLFFWSSEIMLVEDILSDLRFKIDQTFRDNNIVIPFPQRDIHIKK